MDILAKWLNNAYAMERGIEEVLKNHLKDASDNEMIRPGLEKHLKETVRHAELIKEEIERLGHSVSKIKSGASDVMGKLQGVVSGTGEDKLVKNAITDYAAEHTEIATYDAIIMAAQKVGQDETVEILTTIRAEEEEMASWLEEHMPHLVEDYLKNSDSVR